MPVAAFVLRARLRDRWRGLVLVALVVAVAAGVVVAGARGARRTETAHARFLEAPRYGQTWSTVVDAQFGPAPAGALVERYADDDRVAGIGAIGYGELGVEGHPVPIADGDIYHTVLLRSTPGAEDELAAAVTADPVSALGYTRFMQRPGAISTYADVRGTPVVLAVVLATLAAALVTHVLVTGVNRRRRELATCRAIGMRAGDIATVVRWQASALALVAALIGVPLGVATGRVAWGLLADDLGVAAATGVPWEWLVLVALGTLLVADLAGAGPASRARRVHPALALRAE